MMVILKMFSKIGFSGKHWLCQHLTETKVNAGCLADVHDLPIAVKDHNDDDKYDSIQDLWAGGLMIYG